MLRHPLLKRNKNKVSVIFNGKFCMFNTLNFRPLSFDNANKNANGNGDFFAVKNITQSLKGGFCLRLTQYISLKTG
jgi:hypothetical protein